MAMLRSSLWRRAHPERVKQYASYGGTPEAKKKYAMSERGKKNACERSKRYRLRRGPAIVDRRTGLLKALRQHGLGELEYDQMLAEQGGKCAICGRESRTKHRLHIDHCHDTGKVRGLLCSHCNMGIGAFEDRIELLHSAGEYLVPALRV